MIASSNLYLANVYQGNQGFPGGSDCKESAWNAEDLGLIPGLGRSPGPLAWTPSYPKLT